MNNQIRQVILMILDGWGYAPSWGGNAIAAAKTPNFDLLWRTYPHTLLHASGQWVGLPGNERGNSEVGHLNLGAGKTVLQDVSYINEQLTQENLKKNETILKLINHFKKNNSNIHLMGLASAGAIHSHINHLYSLLDFFSQIPEAKNKVFIHAFTDGRDTPTQESMAIISGLENKLKQLGVGKIASICGRYFSMDRDNHWDRIEMAYDAIVSGIGRKAQSALSAVSQSYASVEIDEFIDPVVICDKQNQPLATVNDSDCVIYFNFRSDRARELTVAFTSKSFNDFNRKKILNNLFFVNLVPYGIEQEHDGLMINSLFKPSLNSAGLAKILANNKLSQFHIAETEKYAHVTYFFNGGIEKPYLGEERILVPSPRVTTYNQHPQMSANEISNNLIPRIKSNKYSFTVVNYANGDMVGHTGDYKATIKACETVDMQIGKIMSAINKDNSVLIITADHGNAEQMLNPRTGEIDTEHTANPVPCIIIHPKEYKISSLISNAKLADISPTVLKILGIPISTEMDKALF